MKSLEEAVIARLKVFGHNFEIFVDLEKALQYKEGKIKDIKEVLVVEDIFKDAKKGERVSSELLKKVFQTEDIYKIADKIIKEGEIQITTEYRRKLIEQKRRQIIEYIRKMTVDPRTNLPFTYQRLEEMLESIGFHIDPFKPVEAQVNELLKQLKKKYPIKVEIVKIKVIIPYKYSKIVNILKRKYKIVKEEWKENWIGYFEVPIGIKSEFYSEIGKLTNGEATIEEISANNL